MKNYKMLLSHDKEFFIFQSKDLNKNIFLFTDLHLESIAWAILVNSELLCELDLETVLDHFKNSPLDQSFLDGWKFEYKCLQDDFAIKTKFKLPIDLPKSEHMCEDFWRRLFELNEPIYVASAISSAWGLEGWSDVFQKLSKYWIRKGQTPFFYIVPLDVADIPWGALPNEIHSRDLKLYTMKSDFIDLTYLSTLFKKQPEKISKITNLLKINLIAV
ncbi:hypothetical protein [Algoriphagus sp. AK58]|uniref:hypothetical protein n=1 Tax=Algoriphagus sp. AK58 TaxID=1406877 RepID=UPI00165090D8|nr:hypothetical protein [Algoriphagus sp. AK58]MBC6368030.1 hypothetical protein [Algoriphagus sp. AK58]